ncbi:triose-phosphate isomerase [Thermoleophilia bacterium SCSIO 60948]|nr:triose-phosphate isomerase [Thermoleophilia bacterium SCSIO 60948]
MADRKPLIAGNWKMNGTRAEAEELVSGFVEQVSGYWSLDVAVCPPTTLLDSLVARLDGTEVKVAAQNCHFEESGAYTGEVSAPMLTDIGCWGVVLGHSERREHFCETDEALARKLVAAFDAGLVPILCCGETDEQREAGEFESVIRGQLEADLADLDSDQLAELVIAYEPIWAIGTGKTASAEQAAEAAAFVREVVAGIHGGAAEQTRVLYGGSVKPENASELLAAPDIDGALVGGASLKADDFAAICEAAR